ncbi:hypothetical protein HJB79_32085 [Rhizobium lentis]|uniref:hypothetical protein n=1 Tax=Rhizobium lentis TaxID=1138194 RepID=UPI001C83916F|nr:hypothetical protein [Rhizobium lentis]MBX5143339.1 hypothetical protein [Rhizobium lentis]
MSNFHVGQKVTAIKEFPLGEVERAKRDGVIIPSFGVVYTIRGTEPGIWNHNETFLWFVELVNNPHCSDGIEPSWDSRLFRPVVERKADISIFKSMLNKPTVRVDA